MFRIFAINPGSTSTKIALFEDQTVLFSQNIAHSADKLACFDEINDQFSFRKQAILQAVATAGYTLDGCQAFVGRGGGLVSLPGGTYSINEQLLHHAKIGFTVKHPAMLGPQLAYDFAQTYGGQAYTVNPPDVDEFCDVARITGVKGIYRESRLHALNQKEVAIRYANMLHRSYEDLRLIVCHIGGGVSVTAHCHGKMIDSNDIARGDGPMSPTRCGALPVKDVIRLCFSDKKTEKQMNDLVTKTGGLISHLGTNDTRKVSVMIEQGDAYARLVYDAMIYQIAKAAGSMAVTLLGLVDGIILTGGISNDPYVVSELKRYLGFIAPLCVMAGEFEMEALAAGAYRVLTGVEKPKSYTGIPCWNGFNELCDSTETEKIHLA